MLFRTAKRLEHLPPVQRLVTEAEVEGAMPRIDAGFGRNIDQPKTCVVSLGCIWIHAKANLANLRLGRQLAAAKSVDADLRARSGKLVYRVLKFFRIVWQLRDLLGGQDVGERRALRIGIAYLRFLLDVDIYLDHVDFESYFAAM